MKQLTLIRHAKSSWDDPNLDDFDRPLNARGLRDATEMGRRLRKKGIVPDLVLVSSALRARDTAKLLLAPLKIKVKNLRFEKAIYGASPGTLLRLVRSQPHDVRHLMMIGHNPGLTDFWNFLSPDMVDNIPTCGVFSLCAESLDLWADLKEKGGRTVWIDFPKKGKKKPKTK